MDVVIDQLAGSDPHELAAELCQSAPEEWVNALVAGLSSSRSAGPLHRILETWNISQSQFGELMGVSRQAVSKWHAQLPADRAIAIADLSAATDILLRYLKPERIPAVVRRPASALDGRSLIDMVSEGRTSDVLVACRTMFDTSRMVG